MRIGAPPANKVGNNNRSNEPVRNLYWTAGNDHGKMITASAVRGGVAAIADVGGNVSSVVFNICKGNNNPVVISEHVKVYSGRAVFPWT